MPSTNAVRTRARFRSETVGTIRKTLADSGMAENTILVFLSDHSCHFKTRNAEYKRSPHESSIQIGNGRDDPENTGRFRDGGEYDPGIPERSFLPLQDPQCRVQTQSARELDSDRKRSGRSGKHWPIPGWRRIRSWYS